MIGGEEPVPANLQVLPTEIFDHGFDRKSLPVRQQADRPFAQSPPRENLIVSCGLRNELTELTPLGVLDPRIVGAVDLAS
ncbi:unnamed protein product [Schistocephalus solidus]|uniref:Uncharacterized protein n=1 Tax=Schistocephalus solidus TaxID=70667 RepID=A0A183TKD1_SCHSO|nr:unnamed protein product [Schistocephalus solidus]